MVRFILNSRFAVLLALCAMLFSMSACSDDEGVDGQLKPKVERRALAAASIADASSLVIIGDAAVKTRGEGQDDHSVLHKILESGEMAPVAFKDKDGKEIMIRPNLIRNLSEKYVYMDLAAYYDTIPADRTWYEDRDYFTSYNGQDTIAERLSVIVRKEDGAVFSFPRNMINKGTRFETDYNQNVYFKYSSAVYKMYNYAGRIDVMKATPDNESIYSWLVDQQGNIAYSESGSSDASYMCRLAAGEYARFGEPLSCDPFIIKTETQGFYHLKDERRFPNETFTILSCYKPKSPTMEKATFEIVDENWYTNDNLRTIILKDKTIILSNRAEVMAVFHSQNDYRFFRITDKPTGKRIEWDVKGQVYSNQAAYNFDKLGTLRALSFETGEVSVIYENTEYQIRSINVATEKNQDVITFSAMELRTSKDIVAELRDGKVTVLKREDKQQIIQLERIN